MHKEKNISEVIESMYKKYKLSQKIEELNLVQIWEQIVGKMIAKHTSKIELKGRTLYVTFDEAPLKNEMFYRREQLATSINQHLGKTVVEKVFVG